MLAHQHRGGRVREKPPSPFFSFPACCPKIRAEMSTDKTPWQHTADCDPPLERLSDRSGGPSGGLGRVWLDSARREEVLASDHSSVHPQPLPAQLPEDLASCTFSWEGCPCVSPVPLGPIRSLAAPASPSCMSLPLLGPPSSVTIRDLSACPPQNRGAKRKR